MNRITGFVNSLSINRESLTSAVTYVKNATLNVVGADQDIGLTKINASIYVMGFPCDEPSGDGSVLIGSVSKFVRDNHSGHFMVWNLSDKEYDYSKFDNQVVEYRFPGYPAPPLDKVFGICRSIDGWLRADPSNVALVHCQSGRGRTVTTIACYLAWIGEFLSPSKALNHISDALQLPSSHILIPSQTRYLKYFDNILSGRFPSTKPVRLKKIIMNTIPSIDNGQCRPILQIFKHSQMVFSSAKGRETIQCYEKEDLSALFEVDQIFEGDLLIRIRHISADQKRRVSIARVNVHTGYLTSQIERFKKFELDGACGDSRFDNDFLLDLVFSDQESNETEALQASSDYWKEISKRATTTPKQKTLPHRFSLFDEDSPSAGKVSASDDARSVEDSQSNFKVSPKKAELDAFVQGLDNIDMSEVTVDSDTEELLAELQKEIREDAAYGDDGGQENTSNNGSSNDLDEEIEKMLAEDLTVDDQKT